jgi:hypothetical protein
MDRIEMFGGQCNVWVECEPTWEQRVWFVQEGTGERVNEKLLPNNACCVGCIALNDNADRCSHPANDRFGDLLLIDNPGNVCPYWEDVLKFDWGRSARMKWKANWFLINWNKIREDNQK